MDPLKPFGTLLRSVLGRKVQRGGRAETVIDADKSSSSRPADMVGEIAPTNPLHARLKKQIAGLGAWDERRARQIFVESVLLSELGGELAADPTFSNVVKNVERQLASNPSLSRRLDTLLKQLAGDPPNS